MAQPYVVAVSGMANDMTDEDELWRRFSDAEREREYSPSSCVGGDISPFLDAYVTESHAAREICEQSDAPIVEVRYGASDAQTIDLVVPASGDGPWPLVVFIHGGYWQELSKRESFFAAAHCIGQDTAFAAIDYTLAPNASLDEIVAECHRAIGALRSVGESHRIDTGRLLVCGSSAGAHLAAMVGLGSGGGFRPAAIGLVSGIFDLEPLIGTSINDALGLDVESARRNSPALASLQGFPPTLVAYGDNETSEFKRQSLDFAERLTSAGVEVAVREVPGRNHFDIIMDLCNPTETLGEDLYDLLAP